MNVCLVFWGYGICLSVFCLLFSRCFFYLGRVQGGVSVETGQRQRTVPQPKIYPLRTRRRFEVLQQTRCTYFLLCNLSTFNSRPTLKSALLTVSCKCPGTWLSFNMKHHSSEESEHYDSSQKMGFHKPKEKIRAKKFLKYCIYCMFLCLRWRSWCTNER